MYKGKDLAEMTFDEALDRELLIKRGESEVVKTTVHIPLWVRAVMTRLHTRRGVSEGRLNTAVINHGASILKSRYKKRIRSMEEIRYKLLDSDNDAIASIVGDFQICVNGVQGQKDRRTIRIPIWCQQYLGTVGAALRMEFSSMVRLSMYLSLNTYDGLKQKDKRICNAALTTFEQKLDNYSALCVLLEPSTRKEYVPVYYVEEDRTP